MTTVLLIRHGQSVTRTLERETQMDVILPEAAKKLIGMVLYSERLKGRRALRAFSMSS